MKQLLLTVFCLLAAFSASAKDIEFTLAESSTPSGFYGSNRYGITYQVGIRLNDPALVGAQIVSLRMPVSTAAGILNPEGWADVNFNYTANHKIHNEATLSDAPGDFGYPELSCTFAQPYTIAQGDTYVGFRFATDKAGDSKLMNPIVIVPGTNPDALYCRASSIIIPGGSKTEKAGGVTPIILTLRGEFAEYEVTVDAFPTVYAQPGSTTELTAKIINRGSASVSNVAYILNVGSETYSGTATLTPALDARIGASASLPLTVTVPSQPGTYPVSLAVTSIDGRDNPGAPSPQGGRLVSMAFTPQMRPLVEEYTGTWCGYCPRGYVAMERLSKHYGSDFIGIAYHNEDPMAVTSSYPSSIPGFPAMVINRGEVIDPYYGSGTGEIDFSVDADWQAARQQFTPADISVALEWTDDSRTTLNAISTVRFLADESDADYRVSYYLVGNGLEHPEWYQYNGYNRAGMTGEGWELFTGTGNYVMGLKFNDVLLAHSDYKGISGSLPADFAGNTPLVHSFSFDASSIKTTDGSKTYELIQKPEELRVIAALHDAKTGRIINSNKSGAPVVSSVSSITASPAEAISVTFHNLQGVAVLTVPAPQAADAASSLAPGVYILRTLRADGSVSARKVQIR